MRLLKNKTKKKDNKIFIFFALIVTAISAFTWKGILNQTIEGEGFYYFSPTNGLFPNGNLINIFTAYDTFPKAFTHFLEKILGGHIPSYMILVFVTVLLVNLFYYILTKKLTASAFTALSSSLLFGVNFASSFQYYARGHFQWYLQRICELLVIFPGVYLLVKFTREKKIIYYLLSLLLFSISLLMTQFTTFFTPLFAGILVVAAFNSFKNKGWALVQILLILPFLILVYMAVNASSLGPSVMRPNQTFTQFVIEEAKATIDKINYQLVVVTVPFAVLSPFLEKVKDLSGTVKSLILPVYMFYAATFIYFYKRKTKHLDLLIAFFIALLGTLFLTVYVNRTNLYGEILQGRYLYVPSLFVAFIFGSLVVSLATNRITRILVVIFLLFWCGRNYYLINKLVQDSQRYYTESTLMFQYLDKMKSSFPENAVLFIPNPPLPSGVDFIKKYYSKPSFTLLYLDTNWYKKLPEGSKIEDAYFFKYNSEPMPDGNRITIVDESQKYRELYKQIMNGTATKTSI